MINLFIIFTLFTIFVLFYFYLKIKKDIFQPILFFIFMYYIVGHILRTFYIFINPEVFASFTLRNVSLNYSLYSKVLLVTFISFLFIILGYETPLRMKIKVNYFLKINLKKINILSLLLLFIYFFSNSTSAIDSSIVSSFDSILKIIVLFFIFALEYESLLIRNSKYFTFSIIYLLLYIVRDLLNAWKGSIVNIILFYIVYLYVKNKKYKEKIKYKRIIMYAIILLIILLFIVTPSVSYYRIILLTGEKPNFVDYFNNYSPFENFFNRFQYIDEAYTIFTLEKSEIRNYNENVVNPIFSLFNFLFPRIIFENKPIITTGRINAIYISKINPAIYTNVAISFVGDLYLRTGYFGLFFFSFFYGILLKFFYRLLRDRIMPVYLYTLFYSRLNFSEGDMFSKASGIIRDFIIIWFLINLLNLFFNRIRK